MSSSPRKRAKTDRWAPRREARLPCPECGANALRKVRGACTLLDGTVVQNLERYQCAKCGADLFDREAMREIRRQRAAEPIKTGS